MGFLKWTARYGRNKFYKILLFFIIFCVISLFFSSCDAHAAYTAYPSGDAILYSQTANCTESGSNLTCENGQSFKFPFTFNSSSNIDIPLIITNNNKGLLFKNAIFDIRFDQTYTFGTNAGFPVLTFSSSSFLSSVSYTGDNMRFYFKPFNFSTFGSDEETTDNNFSVPISYGFKPYYCSYYDPNLESTQTCNMVLQQDNGENVLHFVIILSSGAQYNRITISFGTTDNYSGTFKTYGNAKVPNSNTIINRNTSLDATPFNKYYVRYEDWSADSNTSIGVQYYAKGYGISSPIFSPPTFDKFISYTNINYASNAYKFLFKNIYTDEQKTTLNNQVAVIDEEIENQLPSVSETDIESAISGFTGSDESNSFKNLFNALIQYPISRIQVQNNIGLSRTNIGGVSNLDPAICYGIGENFGQTLDPDKVFTYHGKSFHFPCVHYDIYQNIYNDNFAFYPPSIGASHVSNNNIYTIIKIVLDGFLIYILFINILDIYKYIFDSDRKEIEVIDL